MQVPRGFIANVLLATVFSAPAYACSLVIEERSATELRADSVPVSTDPHCRVINAGVNDYQSLGPAVPIGSGRFYQLVNGSNSLALIADCNTREATLLMGTQTYSSDGGDCGITNQYAELVGEAARFNLADGQDLHDLVQIAMSTGASEINPIEFFFTFRINGYGERYEVSRKDRFNLLCGCDLYYPNSAGASQ